MRGECFAVAALAKSPKGRKLSETAKRTDGDGGDGDTFRPPNLSSLSIVRGVFKLLRPKQWAKNLLVFAALIFSGEFSHGEAVSRAILAFVAMCLTSSATYVFNDLADIQRDRNHPVKRFRPLASGVVPKSLGIAIGVLLLIVSLGLGWWLAIRCLIILAVYLGLQVAYNGGLKRTPVADVFCISAGFVLRAALGAAVIGVTLSGWLLFCTGALALMIGFGKRRNEYVLQGEDRLTSRESLAGYNRFSLDALVIMFSTAAAICYGIYSLNSATAARYPGIILTAPFVFYGVTRYVLLIFTVDEGGEPADILFKDRHLLFSIGMFLIFAILAMKGVRLPILEQ